MADETTAVPTQRVADLLDKLANGEEVQLGEFAGNDNSKDSSADEDAALLRDIAHGLREGSIQPA